MTIEAYDTIDYKDLTNSKWHFVAYEDNNASYYNDVTQELLILPVHIHMSDTTLCRSIERTFEEATKNILFTRAVQSRHKLGN